MTNTVTISKDKNFVLIQFEDKARPYKFDINTGIIYGLRGNAIQKMPKDCYVALVTSGTNIGRTIKRLVINKYILTSTIAIEQLKIADSLDNLNIDIDSSRCIYEKLADKQTFKEFVAYAKDRISQNLSYSFSEFQDHKRLVELNKLFDMEIDPDELACINRYASSMKDWAKPRHYKCFKVNFIDTKFLINEFAGYSFADRFREYCEWCDFLNEKVTTKPNFFAEYDRIKKAYDRQKEAIDNKLFEQAMNMHKAEMEFEYGNYKVVIPTCPQDIKDEGVNMHHCVGGYAKSCIDTTYPNRSYIVFIRHKDTPEQCYITCEIRNGTIYQYFLSHDRYISNDEDKEFKAKYQEHLNNSWVKE